MSGPPKDAEGRNKESPPSGPHVEAGELDAAAVDSVLRAASPDSRRPPPSLRPENPRLIARLFEALQDLTFSCDAVESADSIARLMRQAIDVDCALVHFWDRRSDEFVVVAAEGRGAEAALGARTPPGDPVVSAAVEIQSAVAVDISAAEARSLARFASSERERSILGIHLTDGALPIAFIELADPIGYEGFAATDIEALAYAGQRYRELIARIGLPDRL